MAGGEGSRLRPLTCDCPKPMLRLLGRPMMEYAVRLLKRHGIEDIGVTLGYLPDAVRDHFGDGSDLGVRLRYFVEDTPMGTAGSVGRAREFLNERFIVLSGDGITDFDLEELLRSHVERGAQATLALKRCGRPQEYGMVNVDGDGRVLGFCEKPGRYDVCSDLINTGIYMMEPELLARIPEGRPCDFGGEFFPAMLRDGLPLFGCELQGYWCDVGDVGAYLQVHADALAGRIALEGLGPHIAGDAVLEEGCEVEPPVYIGRGARILSGARLHAGSVVGDGCTLACGADVKRSVLFDGAAVGENAQLRGCVFCARASVGRDAQVYEGAVVGSGSHVGARAVILPGVKLWPQKDVPDGERMEENIVWGACRQQHFFAGALEIETPPQAARAAQACAAELRAREILLGRASSTVAAAMWHAVAAGLMAQGVQLIDAGVCTLPQLRHAQLGLHAGAAMLVEEARLIPLDECGVRLPERRQRAVLKLYERQDFAGPFSGITRGIQAAGRTDIGYIAGAAAVFSGEAARMPGIAVFAQPSYLRTLAEAVFLRAGMQVRCEWDADGMRTEAGEIGIYLSDSGERFAIADENGMLEEAYLQLLLAWTALRMGEKRLILPASGTRAVCALTDAAEYVSGEPAVWMRALAEAAPVQFRLQFDGVYAALCVLSQLDAAGLTLREWQARMPQVHRESGHVDVPAAECGRILRELAERNARAETCGGLRVPSGEGWAFLCPDETGPGLQVIAEAAKAETARELFVFYEGELRGLIKGQHGEV